MDSVFLTKWSLQAQKFTFQLAAALLLWQGVWEVIKDSLPAYVQTVGNALIAGAIIIAGNIPQPTVAAKIQDAIAAKV